MDNSHFMDTTNKNLGWKPQQKGWFTMKKNGDFQQLFRDLPDTQTLTQKAKGIGSSSTIWLVVWTPLKNMKVSWDDYSQYMGK